MAKDIYDKLKAIGDLFKQYWAIGVAIAGLSLTGNIYQASVNTPVQTKEITQPAIIKKTIIKKTIVNSCGEHEEEYHK